MSDPLIDRHKNVLSLKFAKLYSPKMKSVYWKYFGFPTNEEDRIITKQNVVCTLCHRVLTNHGNTTNLRAHLQFRHKDIFLKICIDNNIKLPSRKTPITKNLTPKNKKEIQKIKLEMQDDTQDSADTMLPIDSDAQSTLYETEIPMTYEDEANMDRDQFATLEVIKDDVKSFRKHKFWNNHNTITFEPKIINSINTVSTQQDFQVDVIECDSFHFQDLIVNMIVQDLRNVRTIADPGMSNLLHALGGNNEIPTVHKIEEIIKEMYSDKVTTLSAQIKTHSKEKPFCLSFDVWHNVEKKHYVSVYFNFLSRDTDYNLLNVLYCTYEYNNVLNLDTILAMFNLENCTAAIMNYEYDDYLKDFIRSKDIPIIIAYDVVVDKCVKDVLALPSVAPIFEGVREVVLRYLNELDSKNAEVPIYNEEFPWTAFELLKFFTETISWTDDVETLINSSKIIINELNTLLITLDTLKAEDIPYISMLSPITAKILNKKYAPSDLDDSLTSEIKSVITNTLKTRIIENDHLTIAAMLDPRFHRLTQINNFSNCIAILTDKQKKLSTADTPYIVTPAQQNTSNSITTNSRKSHLELFFDIDQTDLTSEEENNVESDLRRYRKEVHVTLDESPSEWWNKSGHLYSSLKPLARCYQCVPCTVNTRFMKKSLQQKIYETQQRFMLTGSVLDALLFLNHNTK